MGQTPSHPSHDGLKRLPEGFGKLCCRKLQAAGCLESRDLLTRRSPRAQRFYISAVGYFSYRDPGVAKGQCLSF